MRNTLIIDGYNAIYKIPELRSKLDQGLEFARSGLASVVSAWRASHASYDCLIVFDGNNAAAGAAETSVLGVKCFFTRTKSEADDEIIRRVRDCRGKSDSIVVISDDNYVRNNSKAHGAEVQSVSYLTQSIKNSLAKHAKMSRREEKTLDPKSASEINKEMRSLYGL